MLPLHAFIHGLSLPSLYDRLRGLLWWLWLRSARELLLKPGGYAGRQWYLAYNREAVRRCVRVHLTYHHDRFVSQQVAMRLVQGLGGHLGRGQRYECLALHLALLHIHYQVATHPSIFFIPQGYESPIRPKPRYVCVRPI